MFIPVWKSTEHKPAESGLWDSIDYLKNIEPREWPDYVIVVDDDMSAEIGFPCVARGGDGEIYISLSMKG